MSDFFGDFPNRPDVPEFWQLSEVVLANDGTATEEKDGFLKVVEKIVPIHVLQYMAEQRVLIAMQKMGLPVPPPKSIMAMLMAVYMDGFAAGASYAVKYPKETNDTHS